MKEDNTIKHGQYQVMDPMLFRVMREGLGKERLTVRVMAARKELYSG